MGAASKICKNDAMDLPSPPPTSNSTSIPTSTSTSDVPYSHLTVDTSLSVPEMSPRVIELCKDLFKDWSKLDSSHFHVETVSGGITNLLLKVSVKKDSGDTESVTVRLYGPNTDYVINRERELHAIKYLSAAGFGAKLLAVFGNGMVQSFIKARTLTPADMKNPELAAEIAKELHRFHQVEISGSKEPQLWNDIFKFYERASVLEFDDSEKQKKYQTISFKEIYDEAVDLKAPVKDLDALYVETNTYMLASHIFWALWALIQAKMSPLNFDYLEYFFLRYNEFKKQKHDCCLLARSFLQGS
ncbi:hypothetical protein CDL15_Pgr005921 [Punica granatum]|uniref:ethanolamine kinase n=1 Tax=Punica granatum TaxID=22663 RepID=A0A218WGR8_PUNGR|nr:hypothetical protein CDL15_Pgr005921 [Punica granatum]